MMYTTTDSMPLILRVEDIADTLQIGKSKAYSVTPEEKAMGRLMAYAVTPEEKAKGRLMVQSIFKKR